jgi:hypothetical protein
MSRIIERALSIINDNLKDQTTSFADPISIKPMARGGDVKARLLQDEYPTHYLPHVGRQVMADGGDADPISSALDVAQSIPETPMPSLRPQPPAPTVPSAEGRIGAPERKTNEIGHYSSAAEAAYALKQSKGPASQMIGALKNMPGVKPEEIKWSGVENAFDPKEMITKDDLVNHFNKKLPDVEETVLRKQSSYPYREADEWQEAIDTAERRRNFDEAERLQRAWEEYEGHGAAVGGDKPPKFEKYSLPGGENYREVLLHLPTQNVSEEEARRILNAKPDTELSQSDINYASRKVADEYKSSHWDDPNVLAHLRMSDRTGPEGEKILHLEELQSDWGQEGRKKGFKGQHTELPSDRKVIESVNARNEPIFHIEGPSGEAETAREYNRENAINSWLNNRSSVPKAPYITNTQSWTDLGLKRALQEAAEGGYDKLIWTPGEEQAARYDLSKHLKKIVYDPDDKTLSYMEHGRLGYETMEDIPGNVEPHEIENHIGKEAAERLLATEPHKLSGNHILEGEDLKVGGEGMQSFYDKIVPTQLNKLIKKLDPNAKIEMGGHTIDIGKGKPTQYRDFDEYTKAPDSRQVKAHVLHITPELRKRVLEGLPAYAQGGNVEGDKTKLAPGIEPVDEMPKQESEAPAEGAYAYGGAIIPGPKLTEENADDFARRLIAWTFATAPLFHKASGGSVIDDPLDVLSKLRR